MSDSHPYLTASEQKLRLAVTVRAGARKSKVLGVHNERLKISIAATAESGKANAELIDFISKSLGCAKSRVVILQGFTNKYKLIELVSLSQVEVAGWLKEVL